MEESSAPTRPAGDGAGLLGAYGVTKGTPVGSHCRGCAAHHHEPFFEIKA